MGCFDTRESGNISNSSEASNGFELKPYTTSEELLSQCYQMNVIQGTPKENSINVSVSYPDGKNTSV